MSAPNLEAKSPDRGQIHGKFSKKSVDRLVHILRSGALSAELREKPVSENMIGPTLGEDTIHRGLYSIALAFVAVLVFMVVYYRLRRVGGDASRCSPTCCSRSASWSPSNAAFTLPGSGRAGAHARYGRRCERADLRAVTRGTK